MDDEGDLAEVEQEVLAPASDEHELMAVGASGAGVAVFSAVKVSGVNRSRATPAKAASSRSA